MKGLPFPVEYSLRPLNRETTDEHFLDDFCRTQFVRRQWRDTPQGLLLVEDAYVHDWPLQRRREKARHLLEEGFVSEGLIPRGKGDSFPLRPMAWYSLRKEPIGTRLQLETLMVSAPWRGMGLGSLLISRAMEKARASGATSLYISACPAEETVAFYRAMGAVISPDPILECVSFQPKDLQMEIFLTGDSEKEDSRGR